MTPQPLPPRPLIGLTTYRKTSVKANPVAVYALMPSYVEAVIAAGGVPLLVLVLIGKTPAEKADSRRKLDAENKAMLDADVTVTVPPIDTGRLNAEGMTPFALVALLPFVVPPMTEPPKAA